MEVNKKEVTDLDTHITSIQRFGAIPTEVRASVVVVTFKSNKALLACMDSLLKQSCQDFEIILVDNGGNDAVISKIHTYPLTYIRLKTNYKPSTARNIGTIHANGELVCFLDDDAVAEKEFVSQHLAAYEVGGYLGVRGKIIQKSPNLYNKLAAPYDLGERCIPAYIDVEGNSSFPKRLLIEVGGFNPEIFAGEGAELSYRIVKKYGRWESLVYWPQAVIYHDYADNLRKYLKKTWRGAKMRVKIERLYPDYWSFIESYHPFPAGEIRRPRNLKERGQLAIARRLGRLTQRIGYYWYGKQA